MRKVRGQQLNRASLIQKPVRHNISQLTMKFSQALIRWMSLRRQRSSCTTLSKNIGERTLEMMRPD
eukprot:10332904-Karenia_brevis.AAC.1